MASSLRGMSEKVVSVLPRVQTQTPILLTVVDHKGAMTPKHKPVIAPRSPICALLMSSRNFSFITQRLSIKSQKQTTYIKPQSLTDSRVRIELLAGLEFNERQHQGSKIQQEAVADYIKNKCNALLKNHENGLYISLGPSSFSNKRPLISGQHFRFVKTQGSNYL